MKAKRFFCRAMFLSLCISILLGVFATASAAPAGSSGAAGESRGALVLPDGEPTFYPLPETDDPLVEDLLPIEEGAVSAPMVFPSTARDFTVEYARVYPVVLKNGKYYHPDYYYTFKPKTVRSRVINNTMTVEMQQKLISYTEELGYETLGWYVEGTFYMNCYIPHRIEYRVYNHEHNGETLKARAVNRVPSTTAIGFEAIFPKDTAQDYTYGLRGDGIMLVYDPVANRSDMLTLEYSIMITFEHA